ncbi:MAG: hypothetical protein JWP42_2109 [Pseudomonas sp.]|nr:hypothetical protein [Pseudomonas sp.]
MDAGDDGLAAGGLQADEITGQSVLVAREFAPARLRSSRKWLID